MEKLHIEIRTGEGGTDSKLLVNDMRTIYTKAANLHNLNWTSLEEREGFILLEISGKNAKELFKNEVGNHRWTRVPPTEKKGRLHTSTITVAILNYNEYKNIEVRPEEVRIERTRGSGSGGQHKNSTDSCIVMTHYATGIKVVRDGRNQHENKDLAFKEISKRVNNYYRMGKVEEVVEERRDQIGNGERSDKRRTYRVKDNLVIDHLLDKTVSLKEILKGKIYLFN